MFNQPTDKPTKGLMHSGVDVNKALLPRMLLPTALHTAVQVLKKVMKQTEG
jgi:hypothetical protein